MSERKQLAKQLAPIPWNDGARWTCAVHVRVGPPLFWADCGKDGVGVAIEGEAGAVHSKRVVCSEHARELGYEVCDGK